jgi:hypothetical protein
VVARARSAGFWGWRAHWGDGCEVDRGGGARYLVLDTWGGPRCARFQGCRAPGDGVEVALWGGKVLWFGAAGMKDEGASQDAQDAVRMSLGMPT